MYAIARKHAKDPTKARICVPDAVYDVEDLAAIANAVFTAFSGCLSALVATGAIGPDRRPNKPIKSGPEMGLKGRTSVTEPPRPAALPVRLSARSAGRYP
jgi:hypothetical protein